MERIFESERKWRDFDLFEARKKESPEMRKHLKIMLKSMIDPDDENPDFFQ